MSNVQLPVQIVKNIDHLLFRSLGKVICGNCKLWINKNVVPILEQLLIHDIAIIVADYTLIRNSGTHYCDKHPCGKH